MTKLRWELGGIMVAFFLGAQSASVNAADSEQQAPSMIQDVCRDAQVPREDPLRNFTITEPTVFSSKKGNACCFKLLQNSTFVAWVTEFQVGDDGFAYVKRCIENVKERTNNWAKGGSVNSFYEQVGLNSGNQAAVFMQMDKDFSPKGKK